MESDRELNARAEVSSSRVGQSRVHKRRMIIELESIHEECDPFITTATMSDAIVGKGGMKRPRDGSEQGRHTCVVNVLGNTRV